MLQRNEVGRVKKTVDKSKGGVAISAILSVGSRRGCVLWPVTRVGGAEGDPVG